MSYLNSIKKLFNKIDQKNIVLVSGNIDDIIPSDIFNYPIKNDEKYNQTIQEVISLYGKNKGIKKVSYFSPSKGKVCLIENNEIVEESGEHKNDNQTKFDSDITYQISLNSYIDDLTKELNIIDEENSLKHSSIDIINCSDLFFDKSGNGIDVQILAKLLANYTSIKKHESTISLISNNKKLILLTRDESRITSFFPVNNIEFSSIKLLKPNREERIQFIKKIRGLLNIKNTINDDNHDDFKDAVSITDEHSFKEILQLAKIDLGEEKLNFKQLYNLANFNKKKSEWEELDHDSMKKIELKLSERVKGQEYAIEAIKKTLIRSFTGLNGIAQSPNSKKPKGVLFLAGPTGVGKTEISKALTEFIFNDESRLIRFDMSEYNHEHSDQRLIGAPPGYVGYDAGGQLTSAVKDKPFSILLFDEIEKAHPKIMDKFLQILEDGRLTSSQGETIDFSETFIIFTSNIGSSEAKPDLPFEQSKKMFIKAVQEHFTNELKRPEILNRIGEKNIIPFNFIRDEKIINSILSMKVKKILRRIEEDKKIIIKIEENDKDKLFKIIKNEANPLMGGRGLMEKLETLLVDELANYIFENMNTIKEFKNYNKLLKAKILIQNEKVIIKNNN